MKPYKAKLLYKFRDKYRPNDMTHLFYEYRGYEYMVTAYNNGYSESLATQHYNEQKSIDQAIDHPVAEKPHNANDDAEIGFNKIMNYFETGEWDDGDN